MSKPHKPKKKNHKEKFVSLILVTGAWKDSMPEERFKMLIAKALNYCVCCKDCKDGLKIKGYLITYERIGLITKNTEEEIKPILKKFCEKTGELFANYFHSLNDVDTLYKEDNKDVNTLAFNAHFERYPFYDDNLKNLLLGKKVTSEDEISKEGAQIRYYSSHLAKLKYEIQNYRYCSFMEHQGRKSPVLVNKEGETKEGTCKDYKAL